VQVTAIVPMRHDSERVPGKNYRAFNGRPLYQHVLDALQRAARVTTIVVDTDSPVILEQLADAYPDVVALERPEHLRSGHTAMNDVLLNIVDGAPGGDLYLQTHSTNPLLRSETIDAAIAALAAAPDHDSLFSVTPRQARFWTRDGQPVNHDPDVLLRTQDLPPLLEENSCLYLFDAATLRARGNRIGARPLIFEMDAVEAQDIDVELDFVVAEFLHRQREGDR